MKNKIKKIMLFLLLLVILCACSRKTSEKEATVETRDLKAEEVDVLQEEVNDLKYLDFYEKSFETIELSNQEVLRFIFDLYTSKNGNVDVNYWKLEEFLDNYMDFPLEPENILCETHFNILGKSDYLYLLDIDSWVYYLNESHEEHNLEGFRTNIYNYYVSGEVTNNLYKVSFYKMFGSLYNEENTYYFSYTDAHNRQNGVVLSSEEQMQELFLNKDERLQVYVYTFLNVDGKYLLDSYSF